MRIRQLFSEDHEQLRFYLDSDPLFNVSLIHGLRTYGLESKRAQFWGAFEGNQLKGVLLTDALWANPNNSPRFGCLTGHDPGALVGLGRLSAKLGLRLLKGREEHLDAAVDGMSRHTNHLRVTEWYYYKADPDRAPTAFDYPVRTAEEKDLPALMELYKDFEFGDGDLLRVEYEMREAIKRGTCFLIELEGRVASASVIVAETDRAGLLNYTRTAPAFRQRGLHRCVRAACYRYLFRQNKVPIGIFSKTNTAMLHIAEKYGSIIGAWSVVHLSPKIPLRRRVVPLPVRRLFVEGKKTVMQKLLEEERE